MTIDEAIKLAVQHHQAGRLPEAEGIYRQVLGAVPNHPVALHNLGQIAYTVRKFDVAIDLLTRAIAAEPRDANSYNTLSAVYFAVGRVEDSIAACHHALELNPNLSHAYSNLGNAIVAQGNMKGGIEAFERSLALDANNPIAHDGLGATLLLLGDLQRGWREREWRWQKPDFEQDRFAGKPRWEGSDLNGKTILLLVEQGYGDVFQFSRYATLLAARGAKVLMEVVPDIHRLMSTLAGVSQLVIAGLTRPACDFVSPLMSVPLWYGISLETIPATVPYLAADARLAESFQAKCFRADKNLKVGLVWAGRPTHSNNHNRSMKLTDFAALGEVPGVTFYSLQKGDAAIQARTPPAGMKMVDLSVGLTDFNWTAGAVAGLDLVIAVDTAVCHLAGALGKSVWVLLPFVPDWRWMLDREDTPWYPTMRLFRQSQVSDWAPVVQRVRNELAAMVLSRKALSPY
jgi:tetratricopeptide (TPR) repeat protein